MKTNLATAPTCGGRRRNAFQFLMTAAAATFEAASTAFQRLACRTQRAAVCDRCDQDFCDDSQVTSGTFFHVLDEKESQNIRSALRYNCSTGTQSRGGLTKRDDGGAKAGRRRREEVIYSLRSRERPEWSEIVTCDCLQRSSATLPTFDTSWARCCDCRAQGHRSVSTVTCDAAVYAIQS